MTDNDGATIVAFARGHARPRSTGESIAKLRSDFEDDLLRLCRRYVLETTPGAELFTPMQVDLLARGYATQQLAALAFTITTPGIVPRAMRS